MRKITSYVIAYGMWIIDLLLAFWLVYIGRTTIRSIFASFYKPGMLQYSNTVDFLDKAIVLVLGLGWLAFIIVTEESFRVGIQKRDLLKRISRVTGSVLLSIFGVDLILFWLQGTGSGDWLRWLILAGELGLGLTLLVFVKTRFTSKPH